MTPAMCKLFKAPAVEPCDKKEFPHAISIGAPGSIRYHTSERVVMNAYLMCNKLKTKMG
jgi:hypothetical protein